MHIIVDFAPHSPVGNMAGLHSLTSKASSSFQHSVDQKSPCVSVSIWPAVYDLV